MNSNSRRAINCAFGQVPGFYYTSLSFSICKTVTSTLKTTQSHWQCSLRYFSPMPGAGLGSVHPMPTLTSQVTSQTPLPVLSSLQRVRARAKRSHDEEFPRARAASTSHCWVPHKCAGARQEGSHAPVGRHGTITFSSRLELQVLEPVDVRLIGREKAKTF